MTANHEHTPTAEEAERFFEAMKGLYQAEMTDSLVADEEQIEYYGQAFDMFMAAHDAEVAAAAEHRGAARALREAATAIEKNNIVFDGDHYQPCNSCMSIHMNWLDYRANQIEGDDE